MCKKFISKISAVSEIEQIFKYFLLLGPKKWWPCDAAPAVHLVRSQTLNLHDSQYRNGGFHFFRGVPFEGSNAF